MAGTQRIDFLANAGAGNGTAFAWRGGKMALTAEGTWGGGSAKLQIQSPNNTWIDVPNGSFTANSYLTLDLPPGQYRGVVATSTAVYMYGTMIPIRNQ